MTKQIIPAQSDQLTEDRLPSQPGAMIAPMPTKTNTKQPAVTCTGTTVDGTPCRKKAILGTDRCAQHDGRTPSGKRKRTSEFGTVARQR